MSQPFNAGASPVSNGHVLASAPAPYHPALPNFSAFPGLNSFAQSLNGQSQMSLSTPTQQSFFSQLQRPPSSENSDLEKLERLKKEILEGQNPIYKAVPQPNFLEGLYLGRSLQAQNSAPAHPDQISIRPSMSSGPQPSSAMHSDGDAKASELGRSAPVNHIRESFSPEPKVQHNHLMLSASFQAAQNMNGTANSSYPDGISLSRSSPMPQVGPKTSQTDQRPSYPSDVSVQDASRFSSSNGAMDSAKHALHIPPGQSAVRPTSGSVPVQLTTDNSQTLSGPLSKSVSSRDPPYDPKESLRRPEDSVVSSDGRSRHAGDSHDSRSYDLRHGHSMDSSRDRERDRDQDRERDKRYDYRFDERRNMPDDYHDRRISSMPSTDSKDLCLQDLKRQDSRHIQDDRMDVDVGRLAPSLSDRSFKPADDRTSRDPPSSERLIRSSDGNNASKLVNGVDEARFVPSSTAIPSVNSHSVSGDDRLTRTTSPNAHMRPIDERSRPDDRTRFQPVDDRDRQSFVDDRIRHATQTAENNTAPALEERIGGRVPPALEERIGIRIPLEERITSPPIDRRTQPASVLQERIGDRPPLEERISSRPASADVRGSAGVESSRPGDIRSIPTPLSLVRPRPVDEKAVSSSPVSASASARVLQQRVEERPARSSSSDIAERPDDMLQPRYSAYGSDSRATVRRGPLVAHNTTRPSLNEEPIVREKHLEASDPRLVPSAAYRDDRDRRYTDAGRTVADVGHYERPILRERDSVPTEDRARPSLDTREWRERATYPRTYASRSETLPFSGSTPRVWTANMRGNRPSDSTFDERDRYLNRDHDRHSALPPRSWDRDDVSHARPPPEVYPLPVVIDRERYAPAEFREGSRVRARSPSPNPLRRSTLGGALDDLRPAKRVRDEGYYEDRERRYSEHIARAASPPPSTAGSYYDTRAPYTPREVHNAYPERNRASDVGYYERRVTDMGPPRSPPHTGRAIYSRPDLDRYNLAPPRTA